MRECCSTPAVRLARRLLLSACSKTASIQRYSIAIQTFILKANTAYARTNVPDSHSTWGLKLLTTTTTTTNGCRPPCPLPMNPNAGAVALNASNTDCCAQHNMPSKTDSHCSPQRWHRRGGKALSKSMRLAHGRHQRLATWLSGTRTGAKAA